MYAELSNRIFRDIINTTDVGNLTKPQRKWKIDNNISWIKKKLVKANDRKYNLNWNKSVVNQNTVKNMAYFVSFGFVAYQPFLVIYAKSFLCIYFVYNTFKRAWVILFSQLNGATYFNFIRLILFTINHL